MSTLNNVKKDSFGEYELTDDWFYVGKVGSVNNENRPRNEFKTEGVRVWKRWRIYKCLPIPKRKSMSGCTT